MENQQSIEAQIDQRYEAANRADKALRDRMAGLRDLAEPSPGRERTWEECSPEERVERLRGELRRKEGEVKHLREQVGLLMAHQHGERGELLVAPYAFGMNQVGYAPDGWKPFDPLA